MPRFIGREASTVGRRYFRRGPHARTNRMLSWGRRGENVFSVIPWMRLLYARAWEMSSLKRAAAQHIFSFQRIQFFMDWKAVVPGEKNWAQVDFSQAREVRLRPGYPAAVLLRKEVWRGEHALRPEEVAQAAQALSGWSLAARQKELANGFLPLPGGHRLGVCGVMGEGGMLEITSLCVRLAHEIKGAAEKVFPGVRGRSALILGPPGSGKTTLLRDLIRLYSESGMNVGVADERGEIAACRDGQAQLDVGEMTDVITLMEKPRALRLLVRSMAPQVLAADEIGGCEDMEALLDARRCGVIVLATAHSGSLAEARERKGMDGLLAPGAFDCAVVLEGPGLPPKIVSLEEARP